MSGAAQQAPQSVQSRFQRLEGRGSLLMADMIAFGMVVFGPEPSSCNHKARACCHPLHRCPLPAEGQLNLLTQPESALQRGHRQPHQVLLRSVSALRILL
jgi:hypothetical protein